MCKCGTPSHSIRNYSNHQSTHQISNVTCDYSKEQLQKLLEYVLPNEKSIVISQLNVYDISCAMFSNFIFPLIEKHNIQ